MWIEEELKKEAGEIQRSMHALSSDFHKKMPRTLRTHMREKKENTTRFFTTFYESLRLSEYEIYKQFSVLHDERWMDEHADNMNLSNNLTYDFTEIRNASNDLPHPRMLHELQREYDRKSAWIGRDDESDDTEHNRYIPYKVYCYIREKSEYCIRFQSNIYGRQITLYFITFPDSHIAVCGNQFPKESQLCSVEIALYQLYAYKVFIWLTMVSQMSSKECSENLDVYFYMTPFKKQCPSHDGSNRDVLSAIHVNTGLTRNCERRGEIIVYRTEEWFKVFVHESIHNFNIDFIDTDLRDANEQLRNSFCIPHGDILLFEAYTETWARIISIMFETYFQNERKDFIRRVREKLADASLFYIFQMVKALDVMNLKFSQITVLTPENLSVCRKRYAEDTNVYAYYIFGGILSTYALSFICWCCEHNTRSGGGGGSGAGYAIRFNQTNKNIREFTELICNAAKDPVLLKMVEYAEQNATSAGLSHPVLKKTMRMTFETA